MEATKEAMQYLANLVLATSNPTENTQFPVCALPKEMQLVDLEPYMFSRNNYRGEFKTNSIMDFIEYCWTQHEAKIFIDCDAGFAQAFFDLGNNEDPGHGQHRAILQLKHTPEYCAMLKMLEGRCAQSELAEYIEDYQQEITTLNKQGETIVKASAVAAIRNLTIETSGSHEHTIQTLSSSTSSFDQIDMSVNQNLPTHLRVDISPYEQSESYQFILRVTPIVPADKGRPTFKLMQIRPGDIKMQFAEDFYNRMNVVDKDPKEKPAKYIVYKGSFNPM